jgi:hypothetical protein
MARPRNQHNSRTKVYPLRLTEAERAALTAAAAARGVLPADFLRASFMAPAGRSSVHSARPPALDSAAVAALARIGSNLNQIARRANSGDLLQPGELPETLGDLSRCLARIETLVMTSIEP